MSFEVGSDLTRNAQAIFTFRWTVAGYDVAAGDDYHALDWDHRNGGFTWDLTMSWPPVGGAVRF